MIGKFKHEQNGVLISEYCGLRSKMYGYTYNNENKDLKHTPSSLSEEKEITKILKENGIMNDDEIRKLIDKHDEELYKPEEIKEVMRAKGIKKNVIGKQIKFKDYIKAMKNQSLESKYVKQTMISSRKQKLYTVDVIKKGMCWFDDKRYTLDEVNQMSFGHYKLRGDSRW